MPPKRKRNEPAADAAGNRPSPHRPSDTALGQHDRDGQEGRRRSAGGGGGGRNTRGRNPERRASFTNSTNSRIPTSPLSAKPPTSVSQALAVPAPPSLAVPVSASNNAVVQPRPPVVPSNYHYAILTETRLASWEETGRQEVVEHGVSSRNDEDMEEISTIFQEFTRAVLENRLDPVDAGTCIKEILGPDSSNDNDASANFNFDAHGLFVDSISVFVDSENGVLKPQFRDFIIATDVSPKLLRRALEPPVLEHLGLIRSTFFKMGIRHATNLLYRQSNYNLLREESEGFAKLITELYWTAHSLNQEQITREQVEAGFERIKGLIGTFDLDVGRVLDIVFDVFASTMMRTFRYFTMFLRVSSWWPRNQSDHYDAVLTGGLPRWALPGASFVSNLEEQAEMDGKRLQRDISFWKRAREVHLDAFFELCGRRTDDAELQRFLDPATNLGLKSDAEIEWINATKTLPPSGNRVAAQLFGFKLRYYTSEARDKDEIIPANLFYLGAYLIKIGFISLPDLYAHLWPADDKMDAVRDRRAKELEEKEKKDRQGAEPNALLMAGALTDDTIAAPVAIRPREPATAKSETPQRDVTNISTAESGLPEPKEVLKVDLIQHLLLVGAIPEALFMLGRFPWLPDAYPDEIIGPINRILLHSIEKVYQETLPREVTPITVICSRKEVAQDQSGVPKGNVKLIERDPPKILKWPHANGHNRGVPYEHYLKEWTDNVPICQGVDDVFTLCNTLLNISGVNIGRSPILLKKLTAIGAKSLSADQSQANLDRWQELLKRTIFPALNLTTSNVDVVDSVWSLLSHYPTETRYNIYAECYEGQISRLPAMAKAFKNARLDTLAILKRLSKENLTKSAKQLAKVALFSPGVVCKVALDQIEAYTNLIEAFVDCARYFTDLGYDVLVWSLMSSLGGKQRSRTQESSVLLTSKWLQALSKFSGKVFRRYSNMDPTPVIQYVNNQLSQGNSTDLVILREFITSMGGIVSDVDFTDSQLAALSGGEELRKQTLINLGDKRFESGKSSSRLMQALVNTKLASRVLANIAQYRQSAIYHLPESETHIKYLATLVDDSQLALSQYVELLRSNLSPEKFDMLMPSIPRLMTDFGLDSSLAFLIGRISLAYYLTGPGTVAVKGRRLSETPEIPGDADGDVSMESKDNNGLADEPPSTNNQEQKDSLAESASTPAVPGRRPDHFLDVLHPIIETVQALLPPATWESVSPELYVLFWSLQTSDLGIPASSYNAESVRLQKEQEFIKKDRSDMSRSGRAKAEQRKADIAQLASKLGSEATQCQERVSKTKMMLLKSAPTWIPANMAKSSGVADTLIEECLIPRILMSPGDADFCYKIVRFLHDNQVANFNILALYDRFFSVNRLRSLIFSCTLREADFMGRFIKLALGDLSRWHRSKDAFEREATKNGKHVALASSLDTEGKPASFMEHGQFRDQLWSWHRNLATALKSCLQGTEWMHIRNAITVLKAVLDFFPAVDFQGRQFLQVLQRIAQREAASKNESEDGQGHRVDLSVTANTAASALKKHESRWVMVQAFRPNTAGDTLDEKAAEAIKNPKSAGLRASAPEFKPQQAKGKIAAEDEDGEVKDTKSANTAGESNKNFGSSTSQKPSPLPPRAELAKNISRPTTPAARQSNQSPASQGRRETPKGGSAGSLPPGLPSKPDVPLPAHFHQDERGQIRITPDAAHNRDHRDPRETRDTREPRPRDARDTRDTRQTETPRSSRGRESFGPERRTQDSLPRDSSRADRERTARSDGPPRWESPANDKDSRQARDRAPSSSKSNSRTTESSRPARDSATDAKAMPPPSQGQNEPQGPTVNPDRARLIGADRPEEMINPARAALINDSRPPGRSARDDSRERSSRNTSPSRRERSETRPSDPGRDDRSGRHRQDQSSSREARNEPVAPAGPRVDRDGDRSMSDRSRDLGPFQGSSGRDKSDHGRSNHQQDPNYGRLNAIPSVADTTKNLDAPRGRGRNMVQSPSGPNPPPVRSDSRFSNAEKSFRGGSPERHPPSGPASSRPRRGPGGPPHGNSPMNTPSATSSSAGGVHPDRLRHLPASSASPSQPSFPASGVNSVGVHPDRLGRIEPNMPPAGPSQHRLGHSLPPLQTPERPPIPTGPNNRQPHSGSPLTPGTDKGTPMSAPTGPSQPNDRSKTGSRRQLAGINNVLQGTQASGSESVGRGSSLRGRSSRTNLAGSDAQILTGASPVSTPVQERSEPLGERGDRASSSRGGLNGDDRSGRNETRERSRRHDHGERPSRSSRHPSRERSPGRDSRAKDHREYRDRDSGAGLPTSSGREGERDMQRRSGTNGRSAEAPGMERGDGGRDSRHRGDGGTNNRHEDHGRGSGGGRVTGSGGGPMGPSGPRGDDHRSRDSRGGDDGGRGNRKRRSEEGAYSGPPPDGHKRQRQR
ncbi:transcription factor/nuclear export subunit protein 2-domain-containing protein [Xylariales sp. PMI_506]|nr:transcription factor/nuclear export subunit protein 2-domain-containing protein [Xylariales sp. PMI_506]